MKISAASLLSIACFLGAVEHLQGYRILAIIPTPSYSHQIPYRSLWLELAKRGHELVLATPNTFPTNLTNIKQIDISGTYQSIRKVNFIQLHFDGGSWMDFVRTEMLGIGLYIGEAIMNHTEVKKLYARENNEKFDVFITELLLVPGVYAFAHRFNVPMIGTSSLGILGYIEHSLGGFVLPSHEYTWEMEEKTGTDLPFWKRLRNSVQFWGFMSHIYNTWFPLHQALAEKYLGKDIPPILDIVENTSLILVNQAEALTPARPKLTNMITFSSFHVKEKPDPLPQDLKRFLDDTPEGFIYFSLGSNAMSSDLPKEILQVFLDLFAKLPYKVVWKFETELPGKPKNVYTSKWLPQQSILGHPNVKLYIYQGGLQSTEEAIQFEVPLIGFPVLADQDYQVRRVEALGIGKRLSLLTVTRKELESAIQEVITDKRYRQKIAELKVLINDSPSRSAENLAWWVEYVIRHKGAPHLRSNLTKQPWYQRGDIDVVAFLAVVAFIVLSSVISIVAKLLVRVYRQWQMLPHGQKKKLS